MIGSISPASKDWQLFDFITWWMNGFCTDFTFDLVWITLLTYIFETKVFALCKFTGKSNRPHLLHFLWYINIFSSLPIKQFLTKYSSPYTMAKLFFLLHICEQFYDFFRIAFIYFSIVSDDIICIPPVSILRFCVFFKIMMIRKNSGSVEMRIFFFSGWIC